MKTTAFACAVLAGTFGFGSLATARDFDGDRHGDRGSRFEQRQDRREARQERREDRREERREARRDDRRDDRREDRAYRQGWQAGAQQPRYVYQQPAYSHGHSQPSYRSHSPRFHRGGYLPHEYRQRARYVNDWNAYQGLYSPPYGHQWLQVDGEFLLVALATGLIANALIN